MEYNTINPRNEKEDVELVDLVIELNGVDLKNFKERTGWKHTITIDKRIGTVVLIRKPY